MIGQFEAKLDEKNRLIVPAKLREPLGEQFYVTLGVNCGHSCLTIYTAEEWKTFNDKYNALSVAERAGPSSMFFMKAVECVPDKQFRFSLSPTLIRYAGLQREVVIVGRAGQAEIWDAESFRSFEEENLTPEKLLASLEVMGL